MVAWYPSCPALKTPGYAGPRGCRVAGPPCPRRIRPRPRGGQDAAGPERGGERRAAGDRARAAPQDDRGPQGRERLRVRPRPGRAADRLADAPRPPRGEPVVAP